MYKLDVQVDTREAAAIERRRALEQERQKRIFNARERTIGVNVLPSSIPSNYCPIPQSELSKVFIRL